MNSLIKLWNIVAGLAESLTKTKELVDAGNLRLEQSPGLEAPPLKLIEGPAKSPTVKAKRNAA
jgi:hypothetical protein